MIKIINLVKTRKLLFQNKNLFFNYTTNEALQKIKATFNENYFEINILNKNKKYPYIWLRDCCKCKECFDGLNQQTLINLKDIPLDIKPDNVCQNETKFNIKCKFLFS